MAIGLIIIITTYIITLLNYNSNNNMTITMFRTQLIILTSTTLKQIILLKVT